MLKLLGDEGIKAVREKDYPMLVYMSFGDNDELNFVHGWQREYPKYDPCPKLATLYDWLVSLGYEMSDDEKALR